MHLLGRSLPAWLVCSLALAGCNPPAPAPAPVAAEPAQTGFEPVPTRGYILISIDALRADHLGLYGYPKPTSPFLDELARRATVFDHAFAQVPSTLPSHMSMFTGLYPAEHGVFPPSAILAPEIRTLLGNTRGSGRSQIVRAVLEGVAQRAADLVEAAETDGGVSIPTLRIDGGMSANPTFVQALADATQRPVEISPEPEATTLGAAFAAGLAVGGWADLDEVAATWSPARVVDPVGTFDRERWADTLRRAERWFPDLSAISF